MIKSNVTEEIIQYNKDRDQERVKIKFKLMRSDPFAFLRGSDHLFYDDLDFEQLPDSPIVWLCGDLHLQNFGSFKGDNGLAYFDINDFDESILGPASVDLVRFVSCLMVSAKSIKITKSQALNLAGWFIDSYCLALKDGKARWQERETSKGMIKELFDSLKNRPNKVFVNSRTVKGRVNRSIRIDSIKALKASVNQRKTVVDVIGQFAKTKTNPEFFKVLDVARRVAGNGSLGVDRYVILVEGDKLNGNYLLDLKQVVPSCLSKHIKTSQPIWENEADRVLTIQHFMQAISPAFSSVLVFEDKSYILKELQPSDDRIKLENANGKIKKLARVIESMAQIVAWAQLRSAGRMGAANPDQIMEFGNNKNLKPALIKIATESAKNIQQEWAEFAKAKVV